MVQIRNRNRKKQLRFHITGKFARFSDVTYFTLVAGRYWSRPDHHQLAVGQAQDPRDRDPGPRVHTSGSKKHYRHCKSFYIYWRGEMVRQGRSILDEHSKTKLLAKLCMFFFNRAWRVEGGRLQFIHYATTINPQ